MLKGSILFCLSAMLSASGCGGAGSTAPPPPPPPPSPTITGPSPAYAFAGSSGFPMELGGDHFTSNCVMEWNGSPLATTFVSDQFLDVQIPASLIVAAGTAQIQVKDTSSGLTSSTASFYILSPAAATAGVVQLVSAAPDGSAANGDTLVPASISETGRFVAFQSDATNLTPDPANGVYQIFLRDTCIGAPTGCAPSTQLVSITDDGTPPNGQSHGSAVSADGRYVAFDSGATNIVSASGICGPSLNCVYLRDTCIGVTIACTPTTALASVATNGTILDGANPTITPDGRYIAFNSTGSSTGTNQIVVRDTCHGAPAGCTPSTFTDSLNVSGEPGNENSLGQQLTPDGRYAAFITWSTNMQDPTAPATQSMQSLQLRDTCLGASTSCSPTTTREDVSSNGTVNNGNLAFNAIASISANGRYMAFGTDLTSTNLVPQNVNNQANVYWRDTCIGAPTGCQPLTELASIASDGTIGNAFSGPQSMSEDGRYVVFSSIATNLVPFDNFAAGSWKEIYGRDTCAGAPPGCYPSTLRIAVTDQPNPMTMGNAPSGYPVISGDGHYVVFVSSATNFFPNANVQHAMVYLAKTGF